MTKDLTAVEVLDRIARLDARLGVGVGAVKERARLAARLDELAGR